MARTAAVQDMYARDKVTTTPERLITMLFDRLVRDLVAAEQAIDAGDVLTANNELVHAQQILWELIGSLDVEKWSGAAQLNQLYLWSVRELMLANSTKDVTKVRDVRALLEPLGETWHEAAAIVGKQRGSVTPNSGSSVQAAV